MRRVWSLPVVALTVALLAPAGADALTTHRCHDATRARCVRVTVPLDRSGVLPGTIGLRVRIDPPVAGEPTETVIGLAGGPGQAARPFAESFAAMLGGDVMRSRRLVTFDQRGTGTSGRLVCSDVGAIAGGLEDPEDALDAIVSACAQQLGPARAHFGTADAVHDIEAVRVALGIDRVTLFGVSYGTRVALAYAAAYPQHVGRLLLDSVTDPHGEDPFLRMTLGSIPRVLHALCGHDACPFTQDAAADYAALVEQLSHGPLNGTVIDGHGRPHSASLERRDLLMLLVNGDLDPFVRSGLPAAVRAALDGDPAPLLRLAAGPDESLDTDGGDSEALFLAASCVDGVMPWPAGSSLADRKAAIADALAQIPPAQLAPFGPEGVRDLGIADTCRAWPEAPTPPAYGPLPDVPALILSGYDDLRTPRGNARAVAALIPSARVVGVRHVGHSVLGSDGSGCASAAVAAFFADRPIDTCRKRSEMLFPPMGAPPGAFDALPTMRGYPPRVGRTISALGPTFVEFTQQMVVALFDALLGGGEDLTVIRFGGLRGGFVRISDTGIVLRRYSNVPGMTVSARVAGDDAEALTVRIGGSAAAHGWLRLAEEGIVGRLDGRRVRVDSIFLNPLVSAKRSAAAARTARIPRDLLAVLSQ
jgi:pimeloyl-ACP methyl ester carboxylesterase